MQLADVDTPSGVEEVVESTRMTSQHAGHRPNVTADISDIPHTPSHDARGASALNQTTLSKAEQTPNKINAALSNLDLGDESFAEENSQLGEVGAPKHTAPQYGRDDVFTQPEETPEQIAAALSAAIGDEDTCHDRSNLEANLILASNFAGGTDKVSENTSVTRGERSKRSSRSSARESSSSTTGISRSIAIEGRSTRSSQCSSAEEKTKNSSSQSSTVSSQTSLVCAHCGKKCKSRSGLKSHMKTHKS